MKYGRIVSVLTALAMGAGIFSAGCGEMPGRSKAVRAERGKPRPDSRPDSAFEVVCKWHAALAAGDDQTAATFVGGNEAESAALAREMRQLRDSRSEADRKKLAAFKAAAFAPIENDGNRTELMLVTADGRRIEIVLKRSGVKWLIARIVDRTPPHVDTPAEVARKWHDAIMDGDAAAADAHSYGEAQKRENLNAVRAIKQLVDDAAGNQNARRIFETLRQADFSETGLRATVLVSTGRNSRKIVLENVNGRWKVIGNE